MDTLHSVMAAVLFVAFVVIGIWEGSGVGKDPGPRSRALEFIYTCHFCVMIGIGGFCYTEDDGIPVIIQDALISYFTAWAATLVLDRHFYMKRVKSGESKEDEPMSWERIVVTFLFVSGAVSVAFHGIRHLFK